MKKSLKIARVAIIAALYAVLTLSFLPFSYGPVQFRISEALTVLPLFYFEAIPGLALGCFLANIASGPIDMIVGSAATLLAATVTYFSRKLYFGVVPPVLFNALLVPIIFLSIPDITTPYWINVLTVGLGQLIAVLALGIPTYFAVGRLSRKIPLMAPSCKYRLIAKAR